MACCSSVKKVDVPEVPKFDVPEVPKIDMPDMPQIPGLGGGDIDIDDLMMKLEAAEKKIYSCVESAIPKVDIVLPLLPVPAAGTCGSVPKPGVEMPLLSHPQAAGADPDAAGTLSEKEAELKKKADAAKMKAEEAAREMEAKAERRVKEAQEQFYKQFAAPGIAAATSVIISVSMASASVYVSVLQSVGPWLNGALGALANSMGVALSWQTRAGDIFDLVNEVFDSAKDKVRLMLDTVDDAIMGPIQKLLGAIDLLIEEQKPAFDKAKQLESKLQIDLPDADDLKKPLDSVEPKVTAIIDKVKSEIPAKMTEMVQSTFAGQLATQKSTFDLHAVYIPVAGVFIVNLIISMLAVYLTLSLAAGPEINAEFQRRLRGSHHQQSAEFDSGVIDGVPSSQFQEQIVAYLKPTLLQILLAVLQLAGAMLLSQKPRVAGFVNSNITSLQRKVNDDINDMVKETVDKTVGVAFKAVRGEADKFFPKVKEVNGKMKPILKMMG